MEATLSHNSRPGSVKAIFILTVVKLVICLGFYIVFSIKGSLIGLDPNVILYTFLGYAAMAIGIFISIHKNSLWGTRIFILLDFIVSIPATAIIGFVLSAVSFGLTFSKGTKTFLK